jgi:5'-nucleotidase
MNRRSSLAGVALFLVLAFLPTGCSTPSGPRLPEDLVARKEDQNLETIVIAGINDIHGALAPQKAVSREEAGTPGTPYTQGGAALFGAHVRVLREQFGDRFLLLDGGDCFQGSIDSNSEEGAPMVRLYNQLGVTAAAVGNHEFDFGPVGPEGTPGDPLGALKARMSEARYPYVAANLLDRETRKLAPLPNLHPTTLVQAGKLKVGVIGLSTLDTPVTTRGEFVESLAFAPLVETTRTEATRLRAQGADLVVITAHVGLKCHAGRMTSGHTFRKQDDPHGDCEPSDEMVRFLRELPKGTVDAVVSGHSHTIVHQWVHGVPVIQGGTRFQAYNLIYLTYDLQKKTLVPDRTRIEGPIPICEKFFENQRNCEGDKPAPKTGRGALVTPSFHGKRIKRDAEIQAMLDPLFERSEAIKRRVIAEVARPIDHVRHRESPLGNLVADALKDAAQADVALINGGGIRAGFEAGPLTYEALFKTFPFDNSVTELQVTGRELKFILRLAQSGARGFFPVSGVRLKLIDLDHEAPSSDLNKNGKIEPWEIDRIRGIELSDGTSIRDEKLYRLATIDFLVNGGDDLGFAMRQVPSARVRKIPNGLVRQVVENFLARRSPLNTDSTPALNPAEPRMILVKPEAKSGRRKKGKRRSRRQRS